MGVGVWVGGDCFNDVCTCIRDTMEINAVDT